MIHIYTKERKKFVQKDGYRRKPETIEKQGMESLSQGANMAILEGMRCKKYKKTLAFFCNVRYTLNIETGLGENEVLSYTRGRRQSGSHNQGCIREMWTVHLHSK